MIAPSPSRLAFTAHERDTLLVLGYLHLEQRRPAEAAVLLRPLHRAYPEDGEVERCLALAELSAGYVERAAVLAAHAYPLAEAPDRKAMGLIYAKALWLIGDEEGARGVFTKILAPGENSL
jgi:hypothetical protein